MEICGGYKYYTRQEHVEYCKQNGIPIVPSYQELFRNKRTLCGRPLLNNYKYDNYY